MRTVVRFIIPNSYEKRNGLQKIALVLYRVKFTNIRSVHICLTDEVALCYNAICIKQNARIGERDERSSLFPLPYAVCGCSANMALTDLIDRRRIGRRGGILQNKKRYPSKLRRPALHHDSFAAATWLRCRGLRRRVTKNSCLPAL